MINPLLLGINERFDPEKILFQITLDILRELFIQ
tara:strand:- start:1068 stop:1169 length:102 start_codon:yes stop_codon:yes gene_type:complete